jgi:hypothetical protein
MNAEPTDVPRETSSDDESALLGRFTGRKLARPKVKRLETRRWYALEVRPSKAWTATMYAGAQGPGFLTFCPVEPLPTVGREAMETKAVLRYAPYMFVSWPIGAAWGALASDEAKRAGINGVLVDFQGNPRPISETVIEKMRSYSASDLMPVNLDARTFRPGQPILAYLVPGHPQPAVFLGYEKGRATVSIFLMNAWRDQPIPIDAIEIRPEDVERAKRGKKARRKLHEQQHQLQQQIDAVGQHDGQPLHPFK